MNITSLLKDKHVRYLLVGVGAFSVEYLVFVILMWLTNALYLSNSISFIIGLLVGFLLHKIWSFGGTHQLPVKHQVWIYLLIAGINLAFTNILIGIATESLHMSPFIGKIAALICIVVWNYLLFNHIVFRLAGQPNPRQNRL